MRIFIHALQLLLILGSAGLPTLGNAQVGPGTGSRVRVSSNSGQVIVGTIQASSADDLTIQAEASGGNVVVPRADIRKLEWNYAGKRRFLKYFAIGTLSVSAIVGTAAAVMPSDCSWLCFSPGERFVMGAMAGSVVGVPVGILAGLSVRERGWLQVDLPESDRVTLSIGPAVGRFGSVFGGLSIRTH